VLFDPITYVQAVLIVSHDHILCRTSYLKAVLIVFYESNLCCMTHLEAFQNMSYDQILCRPTITYFVLCVNWPLIAQPTQEPIVPTTID
jgi:hypothetical protein